MFYRKHPLFSLFTGILFLSMGFKASGQSAPLTALKTSFEHYVSRQAQEKLFVHTDKPFYLAGELLWFKIYSVDGSTHRPLTLSKVAYVELLDGANRPVMQSKIALEQGVGNGSFLLPASVGSGTYRLRAYTAWMQNQDAAFYFSKDLTVVNTQKAGGLPEGSDTARNTAWFYPEGGHLVAGLQSRVGFRVLNRQGRGAACTGYVVNEQNDTVAQFAPLKFGIGNFLFTPQPGHSYKARVHLENGETITAALPEIAEKGLVFQVSDNGKGEVEVNVQGNNPEAGNDLYLLVHTRQQLSWAGQASLQDGKAVFRIQKSLLEAGIAHLTLFDGRQKPVCERLYFKMPQQQLSITANTDRQEYDTRKKVQFTINSSTDNKEVSAGMSMAVYRLDSLTVPDGSDIFSYLWLSSDLSGEVESPGYYFQAQGAEVEQARDNLMLTHGWRRLRWSEVLSNQPQVLRLLPEYKGQQVRARVFDAVSGQPASGVGAYLSIPGVQLQFYAARSDSAGQVLFHTQPFWGANELIAQAHGDQNHRYRVEVMSPFSNLYTPPPVQHIRFAPEWHPQLVRYSVGTQVQNNFGARNFNRFAVPQMDSLPFYGRPTRRYLLDDYTRFTTMEEVLREYVTEVAVRKRGDQWVLPVAQETTPGFFTGDPLVLLDGVPLFDNNPLIRYDPLKVQKIEVVTNRYYYGPFSFDGIINFTTYNGTLDGFDLDPGALVVDYEGLQLQREFHHPTYHHPGQAESRLPDFRSLVYWNPDVRTGADGKASLSFFTSDVKGRFIAVIQGIEPGGACGSGYYQFEVK